MTNGNSTAQIDQTRRYHKDFQRLLNCFHVKCVENSDFLEEFSMRGHLAAPTGTLDFPLRDRQLMERLAI